MNRRVVEAVSCNDFPGKVGVGTAESRIVIICPDLVSPPFVHLAYEVDFPHVRYPAVKSVIEACGVDRIEPGRGGYTGEIVDYQNFTV